MVKEFNEENFENEVLKNEGIVLVDFFATWCGPCKIMSPVIDEIAEENIENVTVGKVDVDENPELSEKYGIMSIPTIVIFSSGEIKKTFLGVTNKEDIIKELK